MCLADQSELLALNNCYVGMKPLVGDKTWSKTIICFKLLAFHSDDCMYMHAWAIAMIFPMFL